MKAMKPSHVRTFVVNAMKLKMIPYVAGVPAIGKSDMYESVADEFGLFLIDVRLSQKLPEDLTGLPSMDDAAKKAIYVEFDTFPMVGDTIPAGYNGWMILLDELSSASEEVMAAIYELLLGHKVGGKKLHDKALVVAAGNRSTDSAIARPLPDTLITRMLPCEMKVNLKDWVAWANQATVERNDMVISFLQKYPDLLLGTVDPATRDELEAYPNPRGWAKVMKMVNLHEKVSQKTKLTRKDKSGMPTGTSGPSTVVGVPISDEFLCLMDSAVGTLAAQTFKEHYDEAMQLPFPWDVAQSPSSTNIPSSNIGKAKLTSDLAEFFIDSNEQSRDALLQFMNRMEPEYMALFAEIISEKLGTTPSDLKMVADVKVRLNVSDIDIPTEDPEEEEDIL